MAKDVNVVTTAEAIRVWIDGDELYLSNGSGTAVVEGGSQHAISWAARGAPGTSYSVKITTPPESRLNRGDTFDDGAFDAGIAWFKVSG